MKRFKIVGALLLCTALTLTACKKTEDIRDIITDTSEGEGNNKGASGNAEEVELKKPDISEEALRKEESEDRSIMSGEPDFSDCVIAIGSGVYKLPFSYKRISDDWTFNLSDYGFDDSFRLGPGERTSDTVILNKEGSSYNIVVGFYNPYDVACSIEEAYVYSISIDIRETGTDYPLMTLPGNLTWGASFKEIIEFAHPTEGFTKDEETGELTLNFIYNYNNFLELVVGPTRGIAKVTVKTYEKER